MTILGIETSCDETALALLETKDASKGLANMDVRVLASLIHSQADIHRAFGGVYPAIAKREHGKNIVPLMQKLLETMPTEKELSHEQFDTTVELFRNELQSQNPDLFDNLKEAFFLKKVPKVDRIAVTEGPGLEPTLWVGINFARFLAALWNIPVIPINHMEGHVVGSLFASDQAGSGWQKLHTLPLPSLAFLISGGHTELVKVENHPGTELNYTLLGQTKDDAVGEAFDKVARLLDLPYPGGPQISKLAEQARNEKMVFPLELPRPMINSKDLNFSFSGLKTAVLYAIRKATEQGQFDDNFKKGIANEFEQAVSETLERKLRNAIEESDAKSLIVGGGVSANKLLRTKFQTIADEYGIPLFLPSMHISGDNALMIALAGALRSNNNQKARIALRAHGTKKLGNN